MIIDLKRCYGCNACTIICKQRHTTPPGTFWAKVIAKEVGSYPSARLEYTPLMCMHCENAPCVTVCPTGASFIREDGIVSIDIDKCIGCRYCMVACPYDARYFDFGSENSYFPDMEANPYEEIGQAGRKKGTVSKCTMCVDLIDKGEEPACVQVCPTKARVFGDLDSPEMRALIDKRGGFQQRPETGTEPSVYYLPR